MTISIHAPRTGSDGFAPCSKKPRSHFNPRSPHGERLGDEWKDRYHNAFQSTLPARGATTHHIASATERQISIHAPRTGSDGCVGIDGRQPDISIHAPRTGSDFALCKDLQLAIFQSTLPARGATGERGHPPAQEAFQSTLPARGATFDAYKQQVETEKFQSTLPARGATAAEASTVRPY